MSDRYTFTVTVAGERVDRELATSILRRGAFEMSEDIDDETGGQTPWSLTVTAADGATVAEYDYSPEPGDSP